MIVIVGFALLVVWVPLRERPGLGTILNALLIGLTVDAIGPLLPEPEAIVGRVGMLAAGIVAFGIGSGCYIGAGLGPGPRDGVMTGLVRRGHSVRRARTSIELVVLAAGLALGGSIGAGTAAFAFGIGPVVHWSLPRLEVRPHAPERSPRRG